jgi:hypothetical protein
LTGLTRNTTPVPLQYPPQPNGKQASLGKSLQYANPEQLNAAQYQEAVLSGFAQQQPANLQGGYYTDPSAYTWGGAYDGSGNAQGQQNQSTPSSTTQGQDVSTTQSFTSGANGQHEVTGNPARRPSITRLWFCCHCNYGPYDAMFYDACAASCGRIKCASCRIEVIQSK